MSLKPTLIYDHTNNNAKVVSFQVQLPEGGGEPSVSATIIEEFNDVLLSVPSTKEDFDNAYGFPRVKLFDNMAEKLGVIKDFPYGEIDITHEFPEKNK